jgi:hypothetical protein
MYGELPGRRGWEAVISLLVRDSSSVRSTREREDAAELVLREEGRLVERDVPLLDCRPGLSGIEGKSDEPDGS